GAMREVVEWEFSQHVHKPRPRPRMTKCSSFLEGEAYQGSHASEGETPAGTKWLDLRSNTLIADDVNRRHGPKTYQPLAAALPHRPASSPRFRVVGLQATGADQPLNRLPHPYPLIMQRWKPLVNQ